MVEGEARREATAVGIEAGGDFYQAIFNFVSKEPYGLLLVVGSDVPYEPYVLGGKIPSWTPIAPLKAWVERKKLSWLDKAEKPLSIDQMAYISAHQTPRYPSPQYLPDRPREEEGLDYCRT